jgi:hypothetical protein
MSWARSGRRTVRPTGRGPRPAGSWGVALDRAREAWDSLAGAPADGRYSDVAAAAILAAALGLWADTAATLEAEGR